MVSSRKKELLYALYSQHGEPYGLSSREKLWEKAKSINPSITLNDVFNFLRASKAYTLHKLQNKKFPRQKILASKPKVIMAADFKNPPPPSPSRARPPTHCFLVMPTEFLPASNKFRVPWAVSGQSVRTSGDEDISLICKNEETSSVFKL